MGGQAFIGLTWARFEITQLHLNLRHVKCHNKAGFLSDDVLHVFVNEKVSDPLILLIFHFNLLVIDFTFTTEYLCTNLQILPENIILEENVPQIFH